MDTNNELLIRIAQLNGRIFNLECKEEDLKEKIIILEKENENLRKEIKKLTEEK